MPEEHQDDPEGREPRMEDLLRSQREILARLDKLAEASPLPKPKQEEPLAATVRRLKWMRTDLDSLIAHFDALLAAWQRQHASGDVATLPELTRRVKDLEARRERLEGPCRPAAGRAEGIYGLAVTLDIYSPVSLELDQARSCHHRPITHPVA